MNGEQVLAIWAPANSIWSQWAAPVLFAQTYWDTWVNLDLAIPRQLHWLPSSMGDTALVIDLPGEESIEMGFACAGVGFRPVPLYNASPGPGELIGLGLGVEAPGVATAVIDMGPIVRAICRVTSSLRRLEFPPQAPPAFLLDSLRLSGTRSADKGMFDNRWMVFPQDFPSANFLLSHGVRRAIVVQKDRLDLQDDLAHAMLRWQEAGVPILSKRLDDSLAPAEIVVKRPPKYRATWYRAMVQLGLRRNSAGGFGSYIPDMNSAG